MMKALKRKKSIANPAWPDTVKITVILTHCLLAAQLQTVKLTVKNRKTVKVTSAVFNGM
jgi:hypothetical protein